MNKNDVLDRAFTKLLLSPFNNTQKPLSLEDEFGQTKQNDCNSVNGKRQLKRKKKIQIAATNRYEQKALEMSNICLLHV